MRNVCGWTPASSAATEMTNTALKGSWARRDCSALGIGPLPQVGARRSGERGGELLDRLPLVIAQLFGDHDFNGDEQVAGRRGPRTRDTLPPHPEGPTGPRARRDAQRDRPRQ